MLVQDSPTRVYITDVPEADLRRVLTYIDKSVDFELNKAINNRFLAQRIGQKAYTAHLNALRAKKTQCLLFKDERGYWTYSGLASTLSSVFNIKYVNNVKYPEAKTIPWAKVPKKKMRDYQEQMVEALLKERHGAVEVGTGLGKSFAILHLVKGLGLKTVVMTPSVSIAEQILKEFTEALGKKHVGQFFDGKKESKKLFVIGVDDSLSKVEEGSEHWKALSQAQVFVADESHQCPAATLAKVCHGLLSAAPYRFFFSGTQVRGDGKDLLLEAITGSIVYRMTVQEGVDRGFLSKPMFRMVRARSEASFYSKDANEMTRAHLYYDPGINVKAAEIANLMVEESGRQVVILVKEVEQFSYLLPHLRHEVGFAHGGVNATNKDKVPKEYHDSDPTALVAKFNEKKLPILVGTSCISTGTDIQPVGCIIFMRGGKSEVDIKQSVGRGTRRPAGKEDCWFVDFDVQNIEVLHRHAEERRILYADIYPDFKEIEF